MMHFKPNSQQKKLFDAVMRAERGTGPLKIAVKSGQGTGKTACSVSVGLWRTIKALDAMTILTAPTMRQCNEVWLAECRRLLEHADPILKALIEVTKTKVYVAGRPDWGVKTVTASKEENAQGFHERNMTIICEEASGISRAIIEQFKGTASNPNCLFLMIGNPNTRDCAFFDCFHSQKKDWATLTFNAEETPESEWFSSQRNRDLEAEFGRDSDVYRVRVLGEFPHTDPNCVISPEALELCTDRRLMVPCSVLPRDGGTTPARQFGLDFARFGSDESTLYQRVGNSIVEGHHFSHVEPARVVEKAFRMQAAQFWKDKDCWYVGDAGGMGQGVMHLFHDAGKQVFEFHNGSRATGPMYENKITEAWFNLAKLAKEKKCFIPRDPLLIRQLSNRQYYITKKNKLVLETKEEYVNRGHESPDRADGCVLAFWDRMIMGGNFATRQEKQGASG